MVRFLLRRALCRVFPYPAAVCGADARRVGASGALGGDGILPGHVKVNYNAVRDDGGDEYD